MMLSSIRNVMRGKHPRTGRAPATDAGFAMIWVMGVGTAIVLGISLIGAYALQSMSSSRRGQDFGSAVQAAQAGVDDFMSRLNAGATFETAAGAAPDWTPVPGATDADGTECVGTDATLPVNCPRFRYDADLDGDVITVTARGKSRGVERAVQVTTRQLGFTDYLYYSEIEAADPADGFVYPALLGGAPAGCENPAWGPTPRPETGCAVPTWRGGDSTDGSRVHTRDVFGVIGNPTFDSRVTAAIDTCAANPAACVNEAGGADPQYIQGEPSWADDLSMPADGLADLRAAAAAAGCTYYGPTRIKFEDDQMRVWSPQTPYTAACGGGIPNDLLGVSLTVTVTVSNRDLLASILGLPLCVVVLGIPIGLCSGQVSVPLGDIIGTTVMEANALRQAVNGLVAAGHLVDIPANGAIYVRDNPAGTTPTATNPPDPGFVQCLLGSALGMYSTVDTNLVAGLLNAGNTPQENCREGKLFVDGVVDGAVTAGVSGDIIIMSNLTHAGDDDRIGLVATGPVEVYNPLQCVLAVGTCLSLEGMSSGLLTSLAGLRSAAGTGNLTNVLQAVPGYGDDVTVEAAILSRDGRFGMQLPVLSASLATSVLNGLVNLNIDAPTLTVRGSIAQKYRGVIGADLLTVSAGFPGLNLASANIDIGYKTNLEYDGALRSTPPLYFPKPGESAYQRLTFAEVGA